MLAAQHCPAADMTYTCDLQSPGLTPLRVPVFVTVIQGMWGLRSSWVASPLLVLGAALWHFRAGFQSLQGLLPKESLG